MTDEIAVPPVAVEKPKRVRKTKPEVDAVPSKAKAPRRDIFAAAFGDKRAGVAVKAIPKAERAVIVAAVKLAASGAKKRAKLSAQHAKMQDRIDAVKCRLAEYDKAANDVTAFQDRVRSVIDFLFPVLHKLTPATAEGSVK